jgi:hypothetical protein
MLVLTPFALCFVTLRDVFMHFLKLTYSQDATVPVPCFMLFLCFRKVTQEIFSELDKIKAEPPIFTEASQRPKMRRRGPGASHTTGGRGLAPGRAHLW